MIQHEVETEEQLRQTVHNAGHLPLYEHLLLLFVIPSSDTGSCFLLICGQGPNIYVEETFLQIDVGGHAL